MFGDEPKNAEVQRAESSSTSTTQLPPLRCFYPCPFKVDPVCATNGTNYKLFTNKCIFDSFKCEERAGESTNIKEQLHMRILENTLFNNGRIRCGEMGSLLIDSMSVCPFIC